MGEYRIFDCLRGGSGLSLAFLGEESSSGQR